MSVEVRVRMFIYGPITKDESLMMRGTPGMSSFRSGECLACLGRCAHNIASYLIYSTKMCVIGFFLLVFLRQFQPGNVISRERECCLVYVSEWLRFPSLDSTGFLEQSTLFLSSSLHQCPSLLVFRSHLLCMCLFLLRFAHASSTCVFSVSSHDLMLCSHHSFKASSCYQFNPAL